MIYWNLLIFFFLFIVTFKKDNLYSPWNVTLLVWIFEIVMYLLIDHNLYPLEGNFEYAILIWVFSFVATSYGVYLIIPSRKPLQESLYNEVTFKLFYYVALFCIPVSFYITYRMANSLVGSSNIFYSLRYLTTQTDFDIGPLKYVASFGQVLLLVECNNKIINKKRLWVLIGLNIVNALSSMSKTGLFVPIISSLFILIYNKKISSKYIGYAFVAFLGLTLLFSSLRSYDGKAKSSEETLTVYTLSPIVAFDQSVKKNKPEEGGVNTFRFFYQVGASLGMDLQAKNTIQEFINVPYKTNVYTCMMPYYKDFGYWGILFCAIIVGSFYGGIYKLISFSPMLKVFYAYLLTSLFLQFFDETLLVRFSLIVQFFVLSFFIYRDTNRAYNE